MAGAFTEAVCRLIAAIPPGSVATYGDIAAAAGSPQGARQVARTLHTQTKQRNLPWHRVIASGGRIAIKDPMGAALQKELLTAEGIGFNDDGCVDYHNYAWDFSVLH